jgi:hypothetical protein
MLGGLAAQALLAGPAALATTTSSVGAGVPAPSAIAVHLGVDLAAMTLLVGLGYRRQRSERGMMFALFVLNVGLFAVLIAITGEAFSTSAAFGLFGMLSLIRLRSASFTTPDMAYTFLALVLGLINGLIGLPLWLAAGLSAMLVLLALVGDRPLRAKAVRDPEPDAAALPVLAPPPPPPPAEPEPPKAPKVETRNVTVVLDQVFSSPELVRQEVGSRLGEDVLAVFVDEVDYVREITKVRVTVPGPKAWKPPAEQPEADEPGVPPVPPPAVVALPADEAAYGPPAAPAFATSGYELLAEVPAYQPPPAYQVAPVEALGSPLSPVTGAWVPAEGTVDGFRPGGAPAWGVDDARSLRPAAEPAGDVAYEDPAGRPAYDLSAYEESLYRMGQDATPEEDPFPVPAPLPSQGGSRRRWS